MFENHSTSSIPEKIEPIISQQIAELDGLIIIYPDEEIPGFWNPLHFASSVFRLLISIAKEQHVAIFLNHQRGNIISDDAWMNKIDLTQDTHHIQEFNFLEIGATIEKVVGKPRREIKLGFGGGLAASCVWRHVIGLCEQTEISHDTEFVPLKLFVEPLSQKFGLGKMILGLTERQQNSLFIKRD